jgi:hypothetical protein
VSHSGTVVVSRLLIELVRIRVCAPTTVERPTELCQDTGHPYEESADVAQRSSEHTQKLLAPASGAEGAHRGSPGAYGSRPI